MVNVIVRVNQERQVRGLEPLTTTEKEILVLGYRKGAEDLREGLREALFEDLNNVCSR